MSETKAETSTLARPELDTLRAELARVRAGDAPRVVALTGPAGIGKTTLLKTFMGELLAGNARDRPRVGYGTAGHAGEDYATVRWALRSLLDNEQRRGRAAVRRTADVMLAVAPEWLGAVPAIGSLLKALAITVDTARRGGQPATRPLADQLIELILELADDRPVVLLLDDLHWADENTAGLLFDVGRAVQDAKTRILVVVAYRATGRGDGRPIGRTVRSLMRYVPTTVVGVARLDVEQAAEIIRQVTGVQPPAVLSAWLCSRTDGNPLFVAELVRSLSHHGFPEPSNWNEPAIREAIEMVEQSDEGLPESVEAVLSELLDDLTPAERRVLEVCAVLGEPVEPADLFAVADAPEPVVREALRELVQRRELLASAERDLRGRYRFTYDLLPDLLLRNLRADRFDYAYLHRRCAEHLEAHGDRADFSLWERLARHWQGAGRLDCAVSAAHRAVWFSYHDVSVRERGLLLAERVNRWTADADPDVAAQSTMVVAEAFQAVHRPVAAFDAVRRAQAQAPAGSVAQAHALFFRAGIIAATNPDRGRYELAQQSARQLTEIVARHAPSPIGELHTHLLITALFTIAGQAVAAGAWEVAQEALDAATAIDGAGGDWGDWSHDAALVRAGLLAAQGRWLEAVDSYRVALRMATERNDVYWEAPSRGKLGIACFYAGLEPEGLAEFKQGLRLESDVLASPENVAEFLRLLGEFYLTRDRHLEAADVLILAELLFMEIDADGVAWTTLALGRIREAYGAEAFDRWRADFRPERSQWADYAMLWGFSRFTPDARSPVLVPRGDGWESLGLRNPAAVGEASGVTLLYEAIGPGPGAVTRSVIGLARSGDGIRFTRPDEPVFTPTEPWERHGLAEPRISPIRDRLVLTYTADDGATRRVAAAYARDPRDWTKIGPLVLAGEHEPARSGCAVLLPEPVDGQWWMYFGTTHIWAAWSEDPTLREWRVVRRPVLAPRADRFDSSAVEPGPPPVRLPEGIVLVYNGTDGKRRRAVGQALISATDPTRVLRRSPVPLLAAPDLTATGLVNREDAWLLYFSTPESTIGVATTTYQEGR